MTTANGRTATASIDAAALQDLAARVRGQVIQPDHADYDSARRVFNGMIDKRPALVVRCADVADVIAAVNFARNQGLTVAVRGGGHNVAGFGTCDDGIVIDLGAMRGVSVDPEARQAWVQGGAVWGDVDHATHAFGLATPSGIISTTGVAGLTLGGGLGHLSRKYGLACDNLRMAQVVTADGRVVTASENENADLFWGLRGGGGNFGIVTQFQFQLHPVSTILGGPILWSLEQSADALRFYDEFMAQAPDEVGAFFAFLKVPPGPPFPEELHLKTVCGVVCCYAGSLEAGQEALKPLAEFGPPLLMGLHEMPYPALQGAFDGLMPAGDHHYWKADFVNGVDADSLAAHVKHGAQVPDFQSTMHLYPIDGAAGRVGKTETAFFHRDARYTHNVVAVSPDPAAMPERIEWVRNYWDALHTQSMGASYVNFLMEEGDARIQATYGDNYPRLVDLKTKYDPTNLFRLNQNIKPK